MGAKTTNQMDLTGKLLIAMPGMGDPRFDHSVILMCSHGEDGAMGLIVNKPAKDVSLSDLFEQLDLSGPSMDEATPVYFGGPVEGARGFVLHSTDYESSLQSLDISDHFAMTATLDILEDMAAGNGPRQSLLLLGYAGWGPSQLEDEIGHNGWLTAEANAELVFGAPDEQKWTLCLKSLGIDPLSLSASAGRA